MCRGIGVAVSFNPDNLNRLIAARVALVKVLESAGFASKIGHHYSLLDVVALYQTPEGEDFKSALHVVWDNVIAEGGHKLLAASWRKRYAGNPRLRSYLFDDCTQDAALALHEGLAIVLRQASSMSDLLFQIRKNVFRYLRNRLDEASPLQETLRTLNGHHDDS